MPDEPEHPFFLRAVDIDRRQKLLRDELPFWHQANRAVALSTSLRIADLETEIQRRMECAGRETFRV